MKRLVLWLLFVLAVGISSVRAGDDGTNDQATIPATQPAGSAGTVEKKHATSDEELKREAAAATIFMQQRKKLGPSVAATGFIEHIVDSVLGLFDVDEDSNALAHYAVSAFFILMTVLLRRVIAAIIFSRLRKVAARTKTTLDDKLLPALEAPTKALIAVVGIFCALDALKLSDAARHYIFLGATVALLGVFFWGFLCALNALLDHAHEVARAKNMGVAAFMPWIKKAAFVVFIVFGALIIAQSLGANVKAFLAGLGIGGLAFALAAQDTLSNLFGSVVVAIDQPFKIGEFVRIGDFLGLVEDMGLRSTKLRSLDKSLIVIPNKTVATETVTNLSRFIQRRTEQVIGLTYDTSAENMDAVVEEFRQIILREGEVDPASVMVFFRDYNASSLDIWVVYVAKSPDFMRYMSLRQRINLAFMRAVQARGLSFAFPTQTVLFEGEIARKMAEKKG